MATDQQNFLQLQWRDAHDELVTVCASRFPIPGLRFAATVTLMVTKGDNSQIVSANFNVEEARALGTYLLSCANTNAKG